MERSIPNKEAAPGNIGETLQKRQKERSAQLTKKVGIGIATLAVAGGLATGLYFSWDSIAHFFSHLFETNQSQNKNTNNRLPYPIHNGTTYL